jgi:hypothetical protein
MCFFSIFLGPMSIGIDLNSFEREKKGSAAPRQALRLTRRLLSSPAVKDFAAYEAPSPMTFPTPTPTPSM